MANAPLPFVDRHQQTLELLPFLANGTLAGAEREAVETHLQGCATCRAELALEQRLVRAFRTNEPEAAGADDGFARILARTRAEPTVVALPAARRGAPARRALPYALAASLAALVAGGAWLHGVGVQAPTAGDYHTLSQDRGVSVGSDVLYVKFAADVPVASAGTILGAVDAELVGGPNTDSVFTVRAKHGNVDATMAALAARPEVVLVAPAAPGAQR